MNAEFEVRDLIRDLSGIPRYPSRGEYLSRACQARTVLHIGCVDVGWYQRRRREECLLHDELLRVARAVIGIDVDEIGLSTMESEGYRDLVLADISTAEGRMRVRESATALGPIEVIICGETIEHVPNPIALVGGMLELASPAGAEVIITTPNPFYFARFADALRKREVVHPDHNGYLSQATLRTIVTKAGGAQELEHGYYTNLSGSRVRSLAKLAITRVFPTLSDGLILRFRVQPTPNGNEGQASLRASI